MGGVGVRVDVRSRPGRGGPAGRRPWPSHDVPHRARRVRRRERGVRLRDRTPLGSSSPGSSRVWAAASSTRRTPASCRSSSGGRSAARRSAFWARPSGCPPPPGPRRRSAHPDLRRRARLARRVLRERAHRGRRVRARPPALLPKRSGRRPSASLDPVGIVLLGIARRPPAPAARPGAELDRRDEVAAPPRRADRAGRVRVVGGALRAVRPRSRWCSSTCSRSRRTRSAAGSASRLLRRVHGDLLHPRALPAERHRLLGPAGRPRGDAVRPRLGRRVGAGRTAGRPSLRTPARRGGAGHGHRRAARDRPRARARLRPQRRLGRRAAAAQSAAWAAASSSPRTSR